jgi:hypothetical protein
MSGVAQGGHSALVVGGGPAGLFAAETLAQAGLAVTVVERMPSVGRKFLIAGRGGLNLTHSEAFARFVTRYGEAAPWLQPHLEAFPPAALVAWCEGLGEPTFVGSSGRVFPRAFKASPLLRAWLARLAGLGVTIRTRTRWLGWNADGAARLMGPDGAVTLERPNALVLALGGASWPRLGSDGAWTDVLGPVAALTPLQPSNCGVRVPWSEPFLARFEGEPLKRIALACGSERVRGEAVITRTGLEGGAVYALSAALRAALARATPATLSIDLRPDLDEPSLRERLSGPRAGASAATWLRKRAGLASVAIGLLREAGPLPLDPAQLAARIKGCALDVTGLAGFERAISTAGGVGRAGLDDCLMLKTRPGVFIAGEMLDWDAPTGGYLLQASFATGRAAALGALDWLRCKD